MCIFVCCVLHVYCRLFCVLHVVLWKCGGGGRGAGSGGGSGGSGSVSGSGRVVEWWYWW